jgi:hypothetical protein
MKTSLRNPEGPAVEYHFNECGYRTEEPCGPKPSGTLRVVVMGTSISEGMYVAYDETFPVRAQRELSRLSKRPVEFQNTSYWKLTLTSQYLLLDGALALDPDAILLAVAPFDVEHNVALGAPSQPQQPQVGRVRADIADALGGVWTGVRTELLQSRLMFAVQHYLLQNEGFLYQAYMNCGDNGDVLHQPWSAACQRRFAAFDSLVGKMAQKLRGSAVPVLVVPIPNRVAAAMVSNGVALPGVDPYAFQRKVSEIATSHGMGFVDVMAEFRHTPHSEALFLPVDGHPTGGAHALIAHAVVARLTDGSVPVFSIGLPVPVQMTHTRRN